MPVITVAWDQSSLRSIIWTMEFCVANQMASHNHLLTYGLTNYIDCV